MPVSNQISARDRMYLPTIELYRTVGKFGNIVPAFNNNYDVYINFNAKGGQLASHIRSKFLYDMGGHDPGSMISLFCSEAVLPGSQIQVTEVDGLRQGVQQSFAVYRRFPEVILTWYSQKDYYTNDVFNSWMDFISPPANLTEKASFRKLNYPDTYKCDIQITSFSKDTVDGTERLLTGNVFRQQIPSSITYFLSRAFPVSIVAAPLAYGRAELIKTTVTFKYDYYYTKRTSRIGTQIKEEQIVSPPRMSLAGDQAQNTFSERGPERISNNGGDKDTNKGTYSGRPEKDNRGPENAGEQLIFNFSQPGLGPF